MRLAIWIFLAVFVAAIPMVAQQETVSTAEEAQEINSKFAGLSLGVGLSATVDAGDPDRVSEATIDPNGFVRVSKKDNIRPRVMLESHYLFPFKKLQPLEVMNSGFGPFIAIQPGTDEIIEAAGIGIMVGWRRRGSQSGQSFNLGVGIVSDPSVKVLGNEFKEDELAPLDPEGKPIPIRFEERDQTGILILVSFAFG